MTLKKLFFLLFCFFAIKCFYAQYDFNYDKLKKKYGSNNAVLLNKHQEITVDIVKDDVKILQHNTEEILIFNEYAKMFSNDRVFYSSFSRIKDLKATTYVPKNNRYKAIKVRNFTEKNNRDRSVFYDDTKEINFTFPSLQEGAVTKSEYTIEYLNPRFLRNYFFQSFIPTLKTTLQIKVNNDINLQFKEFHTENIEYTYTTEKKDKYTIHTWEAKDLNPYKYDLSRNTGIAHYSPHLVYYVCNANINGLIKKYFCNIDDLYSFYQTYIKNLEEDDDPNLKAFVEDLVKGKENTFDIAKTVLYWVQDNIKYVAYEHGMRGFVPDKASNVFNKKFGDCKDMSSLIIGMLKSVGIDAKYCWVGTRSIPYKYSELALPQTDNHMVAALLVNDSVVILDGTVNHYEFGTPPKHIQGKELLMALDEYHYKIYKIPVMPKSFSGGIDTIFIKIKNDTLYGEGHLTYKGYTRNNVAYIIAGLKNEKLKESISNLLEKGNNKFSLTNFTLKNHDTKDLPIILHYSFKVPDYIQQINNEIFVNLNLYRSYTNSTIDTSNTETPLSENYYYLDKNVIILEIPDGYKPEYIPENKEFKHDLFGYSIQYKQEDNKIIMEKELYINYLILYKENFEEWNNMIKSLNKSYRESIALIMP